jgi:outer membrane immunogenic protein
MKRIVIIAMVLMLSISFTAQAQAFQKGARYHSLGLGGSSFIHLGYYDNYYYYNGPNKPYKHNYYSPITAQFNYQLEFAVHNYVGVGLTTGIGVGSAGYYNSEIAIPVGVIANFHFYQLIDDKVSKDIHGDKLDIYAGLNVGSGVAFLHAPSYGENDIAVLLFGGFQTGARYFFTERFGVNLEVGYGKSFINAGITLKAGGK